MGRASIAYTNKDYDSLRRELLARVPQLTDRWTDFNASDLGVVLLELFCGIGDMLAYYLDAQAAEAFLPTTRQRQNVINLCKLISYRLDGPVAATTALRFSLAAPLDADLVIPAGTTCRARLEQTTSCSRRPKTRRSLGADERRCGCTPGKTQDRDLYGRRGHGRSDHPGRKGNRPRFDPCVGTGPGMDRGIPLPGKRLRLAPLHGRDRCA